MEANKKQYTKSFVEFDKVSTSKDRKKVIIHIGRMMVSLNLNYLKAIIKNLDNPAQDSDGFLPNETNKKESA